ncbi:chromosome segregation protein Spc25-domain-containing protein [Cokeromyces recurvatus]|uniref:chromosome segregation protein Spc25-domain-containing protein n=1 Tax=Cokeromyces recurvatus TaxID=90255 RepID=UPI002220798E|nr:chromosome segregation protein Spc25-domain-containing protein [Cokeromyces recurvatus]KAI7904006.1 chromosome segregation protein Spc25-domain-containing protein [Cokeromyces recurvatus]
MNITINSDEFQLIHSTIEESMDAIKTIEKNFVTFIRKDQNSIASLHQRVERDLTKLAEQRKKLKLEIERTSLHIAEYEQKAPDIKDNNLPIYIQQLKLKSDALIQHNHTLESKRDQLIATLHKKREEIEQNKLNQEQQAQLVSAELDADIQCTQLDIVNTGEDEIKLIFRYINNEYPKRLYCCTIKFNESSGLYSVTQCEPQIPTVQSLLDTLNKNRDLYAFIRRIRAAFKEL